MDAPGSNTRRSATSLSSLDEGMMKKTTHVILVPLLSTDPNTLSVLVWRFCVAFSVTGGALSSNPLLLSSVVMVALFTCHPIIPPIAVHVKLTVSFSPAFAGFGGIVTPVHVTQVLQLLHAIIFYNVLACWAVMEGTASTNNQVSQRCTATPQCFVTIIWSVLCCFIRSDPLLVTKGYPVILCFTLLFFTLVDPEIIHAYHGYMR